MTITLVVLADVIESDNNHMVVIPSGYDNMFFNLCKLTTDGTFDEGFRVDGGAPNLFLNAIEEEPPVEYKVIPENKIQEIYTTMGMLVSDDARQYLYNELMPYCVDKKFIDWVNENIDDLDTTGILPDAMNYFSE